MKILLGQVNCTTRSAYSEFISCPSGCVGSEKNLQIWGTIVYTVDSYLCLAAIHSGVISGEHLANECHSVVFVSRWNQQHAAGRARRNSWWFWFLDISFTAEEPLQSHKIFPGRWFIANCQKSVRARIMYMCPSMFWGIVLRYLHDEYGQTCWFFRLVNILKQRKATEVFIEQKLYQKKFEAWTFCFPLVFLFWHSFFVKLLYLSKD